MNLQYEMKKLLRKPQMKKKLAYAPYWAHCTSCLRSWHWSDCWSDRCIEGTTEVTAKVTAEVTTEVTTAQKGWPHKPVHTVFKWIEIVMEEAISFSGFQAW